MKTLSYIFLLSFIIATVQINAQTRYFDERYIYTQAILNPQLINSGAFGASMKHQIMLNYRNKWAGLSGTPVTTTLSYNGPVAQRLGMGINVLRDNFGLLETTKAMAGFSYTIKSDDNQIGFGISGEYIKHGLSAITDPDVVSDPKVVAALSGAEFFDASFGVYGIYMNKISYGLSFPSLVSSRINDAINEGSSDRKLGFIFHAGYELKASNANVVLRPSFIFKKLANVPTHLDLNLNASFLDDRLIGGVSYTLGADNRLGFLLGTNIDKYNFYYSYNTSSNPLQDYNNGSHEITLGVQFGGEMKK
jgi:type IX secretion system PorP/SprF family membrane protein